MLVTVSDKKIGVDNNSDGVIDYYNADVVTASDYYPFGFQMPGRKYSQPNSSYRYGFNGKENDNDVKGEGNQQDYGMRIYDPRLGRFLSVDPISNDFPYLTPYQFASNTPISAIDLDGLEAVVVMTGEIGGYGKTKGGQKYAKYKVLVYENMTIEQYNELKASSKLKNPDATFLLTRDAWNRPGKANRSSKRYGASNEVNPGEYFLEYRKGGYSAKGYEYKVSDMKGGDVINGPDGQRSSIRWHRWDPDGSDGCSTTGSGSDQKPAKEIIEAIPSLKAGKEVKVIYLERKAEYDPKAKVWRGSESTSHDASNSNSTQETWHPPMVVPSDSNKTSNLFNFFGK